MLEASVINTYFLIILNFPSETVGSMPFPTQENSTVTDKTPSFLHAVFKCKLQIAHLQDSFVGWCLFERHESVENDQLHVVVTLLDDQLDVARRGRLPEND
jgi:hypothetical protein